MLFLFQSKIHLIICFYQKSTPISTNHRFQKLREFDPWAVFRALLFDSKLTGLKGKWVPGPHPSTPPKSDCFPLGVFPRSSRAGAQAGTLPLCTCFFRRKKQVHRRVPTVCCSSCANNSQKPQRVAACCSERSERKQAATRWGVATLLAQREQHF